MIPINFSLKNPLLVNLSLIIILIMGILSWQSLPQEVFPVVDLDMVSIKTKFDGLLIIKRPTYYDNRGFLRLLFEQNINLENLKVKIQTQANTYVPNIQVTNVQISMSEDKHTIFISLSYIYLLDNTPQTIQLNFR